MARKSKKIIYYLSVALLLLIAAGSGAAMISKIVEKKENSVQMESLSAFVDALALGSDTVTEDSSALTTQTDEVSDKILPPKELTAEEKRAIREARLDAYKELNQKNNEMVGWVKIPETKVDYPVMQSISRPDYYLKHDFSKNTSSHGVPYVAESCDMEQECSNLIVYGHHMKDGSMFAELLNYADRSFYEANPVIQFDTLEAIGDYQIIGVLKVTALPEDAEVFTLARVEDAEQYEAFIEVVKKRSLYDTGITASFGESLLTLITCEYTLKEGRLLIVAKKIPN